MEHERRLNNWMKLYSRVMVSWVVLTTQCSGINGCTQATRSHGRRWKFRIAPFKKKLREG